MSRRFLVLFATTVTAGTLSIRAGDAALASGDVLPMAGLGVFGSLAMIGLLALIRSVYVDGRRSAHRTSGSSR